MKNFRSLFFTTPAKVIYSVILVILSCFIAECQIAYFDYYAEDNQSFLNAMSQLDSFNYETSQYFKNTVKTTVDDVIKLSMDYPEVFEKNRTDGELLSYYNSIGDSNFSNIYENLSSMKGFRFAIVNHTDRRIYSNIKEINQKSSDVNIRKYFGQEGPTLLIARSCHNPYFATDTFIYFAEDIRRTANKYDDNFDLYISFGTEESFEETRKHCEQLHFSMRRKIEKLNDTVILCVAATILVILILMTVTGKQEPKGKTYPSVMNRLPNDLIIFLYSVVLICLSSLYRTAISMIMSHGNELDEFWFTQSRDFYTGRVKFCIVLFICTATNLFGILKRQYKSGLLFKNTYIYSFIENVRKMKEKSSK